MNVRYALAFGAQPPWDESIWSADIIDAATDQDGKTCGPVFNTTAHQEYLAMCQDDDAWVDSEGRGCDYYRAGIGDGVNDDACTDPGDPPSNYADANGNSAWDKCCACKVYKEVQPLKGKIVIMRAGGCNIWGDSMWCSLYGNPGYRYEHYPLKAYRAQLAGAIGVVMVRHGNGLAANEDVIPQSSVHVRVRGSPNTWPSDHWLVTNDKSLASVHMLVMSVGELTRDKSVFLRSE